MTVYKKLAALGGSILLLFLAFIFVFSFFSLKKNEVINQTLNQNFALMKDFHVLKDAQLALRELMIVIDVSFEEARDGKVRQENIDAITSIFKTLAKSLDTLRKADYNDEQRLINNIASLLNSLSFTVKSLPDFIETRNTTANLRRKRFKDLSFSLENQAERFIDNLDLLHSQIKKRRESVSNVFTLIQVDKVIDRIIGIRSHYLAIINSAKAVLYKNAILASVSSKTRKAVAEDWQYIKLNLTILNFLAVNNPEEKRAIGVVLDNFSALKPTLAELYTTIEREHESKEQIYSEISNIDTSIEDTHKRLRQDFHELEKIMQRQNGTIQKRVVAAVNLKETIYWVSILLFGAMLVVTVTFLIIARGINQIVHELDLQRKKAEQASLVKSEFLANMSHEIRTPLNGVVGMTELLKLTSLDSQQRHQVQTISSSSELLLTIINDILDLSKLDANKLTLEKIEFDLCRVVEDTCELLALQAQANGVEFICRIAPNIPFTFLGDPDRLRQIILNLGGNAVKFTHAGEVVISVSLSVESTEESIGVNIEVDDTGIGIPEDMVLSLFEQFTQADSTITRKYGGTGLGLTISKKLIEMMGGKIKVVSSAGKGSSFQFTLFFEGKKLSKPANKLANIDLQKQELLVVDTNKTNRHWLITLLQEWQLSATGVESCEEALALLKSVGKSSAGYSAVIVDSTIFDLGGEDISRHIKQEPNLCDLPIIAMTPIDPKNLTNLHASTDYSASVNKPIKHSALKNCLVDAISGKKSGATGKSSVQKTGDSSKTGERFSEARVLLVDDNKVNRDVACSMLEYLGVSAETVENGRDAVESATTNTYDLIFMDVMMPVMGGFEASKAIRQAENASNRVPIMAMTGNALQGDREKCLAAGMDDYIAKPISIAALENALGKWISAVDLPYNGQKKCIPQNSSAIFNQVEMLEMLGGNVSLAKMLLENFLDDMPKNIASLQGVLYQKDANKLEILAHSVKGAAGQVGAGSLQKVALKLERAGKEGDFKQSAELMNQLISQYEILKEHLAEFLKSCVTKKEI